MSPKSPFVYSPHKWFSLSTSESQVCIKSQWEEEREVNTEAQGFYFYFCKEI